MLIRTIDDCAAEIRRIGFLPMWGGEDTGFSVQARCRNRWYTGEADDPWRWRQELAKTPDIAYGKFFNGLAGFVQEDCLPAFIALRRQGLDEGDLYEDGVITRDEHRLYTLLEEGGPLSSHEMKQALDLHGKEGARFDLRINHLQMRFFACICGEKQKVNKLGLPYGWASSEYDLIDRRFPDLEELEEEEAFEDLMARLRPECQAEEAVLRQLLIPKRL